ncbi:hypothetical protein RSAG8_00260, partial [Rhizoctonia solani AG-8 WAC10335]
MRPAQSLTPIPARTLEESYTDRETPFVWNRIQAEAKRARCLEEKARRKCTGHGPSTLSPPTQMFRRTGKTIVFIVKREDIHKFRSRRTASTSSRTSSLGSPIPRPNSVCLKPFSLKIKLPTASSRSKVTGAQVAAGVGLFRDTTQRIRVFSVESRKKKAAEDDDDDDDMFATPDPDKAKESEGPKKKREKYLALGDIEGQEFGRTTTGELSDEGELEDEDEAERKKKEGMGFEISSFNMKAEMEEGKFAEDGTFVRSFDPHAVHDKWMEGMDEREVKKAKRSKKLMELREREREQREAKDAERGKDDVMRELLGFMHKGESVLETLQRLGSTSKNSRRGQKKKAATEVLPPSIEGTTKDEQPEENPVTRVTALASTLMSLGEADVYEETYEKMLRLVRRSGIVPADWDPHPPPPQTPDTKYEYRWAPDYVAASGGQASADAVYGPYGGTEMGAWKTALYFGDDAERIQVRRVGDNDWGSWNTVFPPES